MANGMRYRQWQEEAEDMTLKKMDKKGHFG